MIIFDSKIKQKNNMRKLFNFCLKSHFRGIFEQKIPQGG